MNVNNNKNCTIRINNKDYINKSAKEMFEELYIKLKDKSEYEHYSNLLVEKIGGSKE